MRIIAFGDIHMHTGRLSAITDLESADLVLVTGDLTNFGGDREGRTVIEAIQRCNAKLLAVPGNLDHPGVLDYLNDNGLSLHGQGRQLDQVEVLGVGGSNPTPFGTPGEYSESQLGALLASGRSQLKGELPLILVSHAPPHGTKADRLRSGAHVGSTAVRGFIDQEQPALCLTGHIHEARSMDRLGATLIINPGMLQDGGWVEVTVGGGQVEATLHP